MIDRSPSLRHAAKWGIVILALMLRAGMMLSAPERLTEDRDLYLGIAAELREGHGFATPGSDPPRPTAFRPPLYPLLLTVTGGTRWGVATLHFVLAGLMVLATGAAASRCSCRGDAASVSLGSVVAGLIVSLDPLLILYSGQPMTETLCSCLSALLLLEVMAEQQSTTGKSLGADDHKMIEGGGPDNALQADLLQPGSLQAGWRWTVTVGLLWGLCLLARPTYFVPLGLWSVSRIFFRGSRTIGERVRSGVMVGVVALMVVAPWGVRNWLVFGQPILTTTHGGYTLWLANNPVYYTEVVEGGGRVWEGESLDRWQKETNSAMDQEGIQSEVDRDRWQSQRAFAFIRANPWRFVTACLHRGRSFWSIWPGRSADLGLPLPILWVIAGGYAALWVGGIAGTLRVIGAARWGHLQLAVSLIVGFLIVHLVYWTDPRMRAPVMPAVALIIAVGLFPTQKESPPTR